MCVTQKFTFTSNKVLHYAWIIFFHQIHKGRGKILLSNCSARSWALCRGLRNMDIFHFSKVYFYQDIHQYLFWLIKTHLKKILLLRKEVKSKNGGQHSLCSSCHRGMYPNQGEWHRQAPSQEIGWVSQHQAAIALNCVCALSLCFSCIQ